MNKLYTCLLLLLCSTTLTTQAQTALRQQIATITRSYKATIGVALMQLENGDTLTIGNQHHYPMQSVYKFPLAMAVLAQVDKGHLSLTQKVPVRKSDLRATWSPLKVKYPEGHPGITIAELLQYTISQSDNNTCDILFRLMKGTAPVAQYIRGLGIKDMAIRATEKEMSQAWPVQYTNWTTPFEMVRLLAIFHRQQQLSANSGNFLMQLMVASANSPKRLKGLLPVTATVAHKTGTSDTNAKGLRAATNDVGIITLPNGQHLAIAVFVSDTMEPDATNEKIIALVSKAAYDYFTAKK